MINYNEKIDYLFCKYIVDEIIINHDEKLLKDVYYEHIPPTNSHQILMLKTKKILSFIKNPSTSFNIDNIYKILKMLSDKNIIQNKEHLIDLIDERKINNTNFSKECFIKIIEKDIFVTEYNKILAKIIHNFIEIKNSRIPIVFYYYEVNIIINLIKNGEIDKCNLYFLDLYIKSNKYNESHNYISQEEMISKIFDLKDILKNKFHIDSLYIFGSYSRNEQTCYSDLDIYVEINKDYMNDLKIKYYLIDYLQKKLCINVDGIVKDQSFTSHSLTSDIKRDLKKII